MAERGDHADLVVLDGDVWTGDPETPRAKALAARDGLLVAVGANAEAERWVGEATEVLELAGAFVCPGFVDAHTHVASAAGRASWLKLDDCGSLEDVLARVAERAKAGGWVLGRGWDESRWPTARYLTRQDLDAVTGKVPAVLVRVDGHMLTCNTAALQELKVPVDLAIQERDAGGQPTGVLKEAAANLAWERMKATAEDILAGLPATVRHLHSLGITSVHDFVGAEGMRAWTRWRQGSPTLRVYTCVLEGEVFAEVSSGGLSTGMGDDWLRLGAAKVFGDGSLGARTAALSRPYADDRKERGLLVHPLPELRDRFREAHYGAFQIAAHAIGDRAVSLVAKEIASLEGEGHRHRIEHFELPTDEVLDLAREKRLLASMQPNFVAQWSQPGGMYERRLGKRVARNNPYREILKRGIPLGFGSDGMPYGPLYGIHAAVNAPFEVQRLTAEEALRAYTAGGAYAASEEARKGTLTKGKLADLVVLSESPLEHPDRIDRIAVESTVVHGRIVWETPEAGERGPGKPARETVS